ncbi:MAG: hypothetical protein J0I00_18390 [Burkholderiales bacterium]|uniref:Uncharacterized protein n=1 Tax=Ottowia pentelensis TaxID=511108 RepID=A0ABV6PPK1_9BURK|nr:hypothetical protein [Ottowia sp.]MBN9407372.1 hypothetical protein [Burkholderiales bacterium]MBS0403202.1 hypothetical protein [Pseudomonadota bacterium]MBS0415017.1 hypothetical protein [Pseudomonadota bacterium]
MKAMVPALLSVVAVLAGCAAGPPPAADFPPGARIPATGEITSLLRGKSFTLANPNGSTTRVDHAADASSGIVVYFGGRSDSGTWRAEDGRVCYQFKTIPSACNDVRMVGANIYFKRGSSGQVVQLVPR